MHNPAPAGHAAGSSAAGLSAFGLSVIAEAQPPGAWPERAVGGRADLWISLVGEQEIARRWSGAAAIGWEGVIDGARLLVERGVAGDHRFVHGDPPGDDGRRSTGTRAIHHLSADSGVLCCSPVDRSDQSWWRLVLDSVLFTVALLHGHEALHAGAIATPAGAIAIAATTGGGKSTLLAELLGRGYLLLADDVLVLEQLSGGALRAHPGPPLMTLPAQSLPSLPSGEAPQTLCSLGDERWIAMPVASEPQPLQALVVLDRGSLAAGERSQAHLERIEQPLATLLGSLMSFPRTPERERARFELAASISREARIWRLTASPEVPASTLADLLLECAL